MGSIAALLCDVSDYWQLEGKLVEQHCRFIGCMMEAEFAEAMEKIVPGNSDLLSHRLFLQGMLSFEEESNSSRQTLPIRNLACILQKIRYSLAVFY